MLSLLIALLDCWILTLLWPYTIVLPAKFSFDFLLSPNTLVFYYDLDLFLYPMVFSKWSFFGDLDNDLLEFLLSSYGPNWNAPPLVEYGSIDEGE